MTNVSIAIYGWLRGLLASAQEERGQDLVEYAVLVGLIGIVAAAGIVTILNTGVWTTFATEIKECITFKATCDDLAP